MRKKLLSYVDIFALAEHNASYVELAEACRQSTLTACQNHPDAKIISQTLHQFVATQDGVIETKEVCPGVTRVTTTFRK